MVFELLFIVFVLVSLISLIYALVLAVRACRSAAKRLLKVLGTGWVVYLSIVFVVSATRPQRVVPMNQDFCFDELCFAVANARVVPSLGSVGRPLQGSGAFYVVTVRVTSHARGRSQRENGLRALLWSPRSQYEVSPTGQRDWDWAHSQTVPLTSLLQPGQSVLSDQVFEVSDNIADFSLVLSHGFTPGYFVIGECPLFHEPTIMRLSP